MTIIRIFILGLATLAEHDDGSVTILLRDSTGVFYSHDGTCVEPHMPTLHWYAANCTGSCASSEKSYEGCNSVPATTTAPWHLDEHELRIEAGDIKSVELDLPDGLLRMKKLQPLFSNAGRFDPDWHTTKRSGAVARLRFNGSSIRTCHFVNQEGDSAPRLVRRPGGKDLGPLAEVLVAEIRAEADKINLWANHFHDKNHDLRATLEPVDCGRDRCLTLVLSNQPPERGHRPPVARHVERLYHFSQREPKPHNKKVPMLPEDPEPSAVPSCSFGADEVAKLALEALVNGKIPERVAYNARERPFLRDVSRRSPNNRPICPLGGY